MEFIWHLPHLMIKIFDLDIQKTSLQETIINRNS
ncbi:Uncharacterised protein [Klebsiella pneumoniae]|nr:Uncharacterised protein [Klebsiella pneumoniae]